MFISVENARIIANEMKSLTGKNINIMDEHGVIIASTDPTRVGSLHEGACRLLGQGLEELVVREGDDLRNTIPGTNLPIQLGGEAVGVIGITGEPEQVTVLGKVIKRMTEIMAESLRRSEDEMMLDSARGLFVENWLFSDSADAASLEMRGKLLGINIMTPRTVVMLELRPAPEAARGIQSVQELQNNLLLKSIRIKLSGDPQSLCVVINQRIVVMLSDRSGETITKKMNAIREEIEMSCGVKAYGGVSSGALGSLELRRAYQEAKLACQAAVMSASRQLVFYSNTSPEFIARSIPQNVRDDILGGVFARCSEAERAEILETLAQYYKADGNIEKAAAELYVHRNTFQYRLNKIQEKTGYNIRIPKDAFMLYLTRLFCR